MTKPVVFDVNTLHGSWSWRCTRCGITRRDQSFPEFSSSMHAHSAKHATYVFGQQRTEP